MTLTNKLKEMRRREEGFTIVELLIVIVVIAILAALVITSYLGIQQRARDTERQTDVREIANVVQLYATENEGYPECTEVTTTVMPNLDANALTPPGQDSLSALTSGRATDDTRYGCLLGEGDTGMEFSWWAESLPEGENNPMTRTIGNYTAPTP